MLSLILGLVVPLGGIASVKAEGNDPELIDQALKITKGAAIEGKFEKPGIRWYSFTPEASDIRNFSHVELQAKSSDYLNISFYSSKDNALKERTFEPYRLGTYPGEETGKIEFPFAWEGPYYIKVEYLGKAESDEVTEIKEPDSSSETEQKVEEEQDLSTSYTLALKGMKKPPSKDMGLGENCVVELSAANKSGSKAMLQSIRQFRDGVLSKTQEGRELSALYYKAAPFVLVKMGKDKGSRDFIYKNLLILQPLIEALNSKGLNSNRVISKQEQVAIEALFNFVKDASPSLLQKEMAELAQKAGIKSLAGDSATSTLKKMGLKLSAGTSNGDKLIIKMKPGKSLKNAASRSVKTYNVAKAEPVAKSDALLKDMYVLDLGEQLPSGMSAKAVTSTVAVTAKQIEALPEVEYVEKAKTYQAHSADLQYPYQWSLANNGQNSGKKGADISNVALQNLASKRNLKKTVIAVVDTGVDGSLADMKESVDMSIGKNFLDEDEPATDGHGHGTHVAGIIAAAANNNYSMAGINQRATIMPVKVLNEVGFGDTEEIAYGIKYAVDNGAKVINLSLGGQYSRTMEYVLKYAASKGVIVIAASGNDNSEDMGYPASSKYVISVGGTNSLDIVSDFSNYANTLDLVAPGSNIPSLVPNGNVTYMSGTSMAAPHVAAVAGLMVSRNSKLSIADVRKALQETAVENKFVQEEQPEDMFGDFTINENGEMVEVEKVIPTGADLYAGFGRLNAYNAFSKIDLNVKLKPVVDNVRLVSGTATKGSKVEVKKGNAVLAKGTVNAKGAFSLKIPVQKEKTKLLVTISSKDAKTTLRTYVTKGKAPVAPKVNAISNNTTYATGTAPRDTKVVITNAKKKVIAQGNVDRSGKFKVKMAKQKAGTALYVKSVDIAKHSSKQVKVVVKKAK